MTWDNIIALTSVLISLSAVWTSVISLRNSNRITSYEHMIKQRLDTFDNLRNRFEDLKLLTSAEYIDLHRKKITNLEYSEQLCRTICNIEIILSKSEIQEYLLIKEIYKLKEKANAYFNNAEEPVKKDLKYQIEVVFIFIDIYMWTLWQYLQELYKKPKKKLQKLFNQDFEKAYDGVKVNCGTNSFFKNYKEIKDILGKEKKR